MTDKCYYCKIEQEVENFKDSYSGIHFICDSCYSVNSRGWENLKYHFSESDSDKKKTRGFLSYFKL